MDACKPVCAVVMLTWMLATRPLWLIAELHRCVVNRWCCRTTAVRIRTSWSSVPMCESPDISRLRTSREVALAVHSSAKDTSDGHMNYTTSEVLVGMAIVERVAFARA